MKMRPLIAFLAAVCCLIAFSGCQKGLDEGSSRQADSASSTETELYENELSYREEDAVIIELDGNAASVIGDGAFFSDQTVTISSAGVYLFRGEFSGSIVIDAGKEDTVKVVLDGVSVQSDRGPVLYQKQAAKTVLILAPNSNNFLADGEDYSGFSADENNPNSALFFKDDLLIGGEGALAVDGNYHHGISCKDNLTVLGGKITVTALGDGIRGTDSVTVENGQLDLNVQGDGIQSSQTDDNALGWISISGGVFSIEAGNDGIQAETALKIDGGSFSIVTGGGSGQTGPSVRNQEGGLFDDNTALEESAKGLKAGGDMTLAGGSFQLDCLDDGIHSNGNILISGGEFSIDTGDDGIHSGEKLTIQGGNISILQSYEGLEAKEILIQDGEISVISSDDGLNAADGSGSGFGMMGSAEGVSLTVNGGYIMVNASGDGIDSNGGIYLNGGILLVSGPAESANGSLDYEKECVVTGGVFVAAGSSGMAMAPSQSSSQYSLMVNCASQPADTLITLSDTEGIVLLSYLAPKTFSNVVFSLPDLKEGGSYTVSFGGNNESCDENGFAQGGELSGGTEAGSATLSGMSSTVSFDGALSGMGGGMRGGFDRGGKMNFPGSGSMPELPDGSSMPAMPGGQTPPDFSGSGTKTRQDGSTKPSV